MKRNLKWIVAVFLAVIASLLIFPVGKPFVLPFAAEDVSSVIVWSFWGYKEATESSDIALIVDTINDTRLCGEFDFETYEPRDGDDGCQFFFVLKDGSTFKYHTVPKPGLTSIFQDADGTYYKAKSAAQNSIIEELDVEIQHGNPFETE